MRLVGGGSLLVGSACLAYQHVDRDRLVEWIMSKLIRVADCEVATKASGRNRTAHYEKTIGGEAAGDSNSEAETSPKKKDEAAFDWREFMRLIYQEKFYFLAAIAVSI